jgi:hypothetical protein
MSRFGSWALSAVIHGALLLGAMIPALAVTLGTGDGGDGESGFLCRLSEAPWRFERMDRPADVFLHERPELPRAMIDEPGFSGASGTVQRPGCYSCDDELLTGIPCLTCTGGIPWAKLPLGAYQAVACPRSQFWRREFRPFRVTCGNDRFDYQYRGSR